MELPKPLYEALPYMYVGFGLVALVMIESGVKFIPGALLIITGLIVFHLRFHHRQEEEVRIQRRKRLKAKGRL